MTWTRSTDQHVTIVDGATMTATHGIHTQKIPYDVAYFCLDPCTQILWDSLVNDRNDQTVAAKADRAKRRAARAELQALAQQARSVRP